jgi:hypothetical protein
MAASDALKRLGGGRWETRDGRFQIEPQSGTWVIVDTIQTNEFGLPLVRGPFGTLTAAREAIETARGEGPVESPLADRIEKASQAASSGTKPAASRSRRPTGGAGRKSDAEREAKTEPEPEKPPEPPPEPGWIRALGATDRRKARELIERLEGLAIDHAEEIARAEIARREPALARAALERRLRAAAGTAISPRTAIAAAIEVVLQGRDDDLGARWRLIDAEGRQIDAIDLGDG